MSLKVDFNSVNERDMDILFLEAIGSDNVFFKLFLNKIQDFKDRAIEVLSIELSKTDKDGESDITVIIQCGEIKVGLLIEDKINAPAMSNQCARYDRRGEKAITKGEFSKFYVFLVSPEKYREQDEEAKKYKYFVSYEECKNYFESKTDCLSKIWVHQFEQAIEKAKKQSVTEFNEMANASFNEYVNYQKTNFPDLNLATNPDKSNGYWPRFRTNVKEFYIIHKPDFGCVDLTINGSGHKKAEMKMLENCLHKFGFSNLRVLTTHKSAAIRIDSLHTFSFKTGLPESKEEVFNECFCAMRQLLEIMDFVESIINLTKK